MQLALLHLPFPSAGNVILYSQNVASPEWYNISYTSETLLVLLKCIYPPAGTVGSVFNRYIYTTFPHHYACITISVVQQKVNVYSSSCHVLIDKPLLLLSKIDTIIVVPMNDNNGVKFYWVCNFTQIVFTTKSVMSTIFTRPFIYIGELKNNY